MFGWHHKVCVCVQDGFEIFWLLKCDIFVVSQAKE